MGEEIYYVRVATAHNAHACVGLPMQIPPGQTRGARHPYPYPLGEAACGAWLTT